MRQRRLAQNRMRWPLPRITKRMPHLCECGHSIIDYPEAPYRVSYSCFGFTTYSEHRTLVEACRRAVALKGRA